MGRWWRHKFIMRLYRLPIKTRNTRTKSRREKKEAIDDIKGTIDFFADSYMSALSLYEQGYRKQ